MGAHKDLYGILGLPKGADGDAIKKAYRALARQYHPDRNPGDATAEERFKEISAANAVLSDDGKRKLYDEFGPDGLRDGFDAEAARNFSRWSGAGGHGFDFGGGNPFGGGLGGFGDLEEMLGGLFGGGGRRRARPQRGGNVEAEARISLSQALEGTELPLPDRGGAATVPKGVADGQKMRVRGLGGHGGAGRGDLILTITITTPPGFRREEDDLHFDLPVTVGQAVRGEQVEMPTPEGGLIKLRIPAGTQSGRKMRLKGKGMPLKGGTRGNLYVHPMVLVPTGDDPELLALVEKLESFYD
jgi:curved DNA-binding protein